MALVLADRVQETSTTSGTGTLTLLGAALGYVTFSSAVGNGNTTYYVAYDPVAYTWEVGIGTVGAGTLARDTVLSNSSGTTAKISFTGNTLNVWCDYPSGKMVSQDTLYATGAFQGTFTNGVVADYSSSFGRISVGASAGIRFFQGGVGTTELGGFNASGALELGSSAATGSSGQIPMSNGGSSAPTWISAGNTTANIGYLNIPQNAQTGNYTLVEADSGKHLYHAVGAGAATYTIPANSSVSYAIGTAITFVNMSTTSVSIAITSDTMYLAGAGTTGTRTLAQYGTATALKLTSTTWVISGAGLS